MVTVSTFRKAMDKSSNIAVGELHKLALEAHSNYGTHNSKRLDSALKLTKLHHLIGNTLLTPSVHAEHSKNLGNRYLKKLEQVQDRAIQQGKPREFDARSEFRFLTLIHALEAPSIRRVYKAIDKLRRDLTEATEKSVGVWLLGAIEIEVISLEMMRQISSNRSVTEARKADVCEGLLTKLPLQMHGLNYYFLVHFHGIAHARSSNRFEQYYTNLKQYKGWRTEARQIELKNLSEHYGGKKKSTEKSLLDIARYITKGGNDWIGSKAYLRYKLSFDNEFVETEDGWISRNRKRNAELRKEHQEEGLEDPLAMTAQEIGDLATVIDNLMSQARGRTGYLISAKSKRKLTTTE